MATTTVEDNNVNPIYLNATDKFTNEEVENANKAADHWYFNIGANIIPADTKSKEACILNSWKQYQTNPVPLEVFEKWKQLGLFAYGIAVVLGQLWRGKNAGKFLNLIDADNRLALQEICSRDRKTISIEELANWTLVEQHKDDIDRGHIYILSTKPFPTKASDKGKPDTANRIANNFIPGIEVKNEGSLSFGWNSLHQGGYRYEFVNSIDNPVLCDEYPEHINSICKKYGLEYLDENGKGKGGIPIAELFKADTIIYEGNNRHLQQLRVNDSLIASFKDVLPLDKIKQLSMEWNQAHCKPPLDNKDFDKLFDQSLDFISENNKDDKGKDDVGVNEQETKSANGNTNKTCYIHKYSKGIPIAEAIIVSGKPYFIQMKGGLDFDLLDKITIGNIEAKPKDTYSYLCEPYVFGSGEEIRHGISEQND